MFRAERKHKERKYSQSDLRNGPPSKTLPLMLMVNMTPSPPGSDMTANWASTPGSPEAGIFARYCALTGLLVTTGASAAKAIENAPKATARVARLSFILAVVAYDVGVLAVQELDMLVLLF